MSVSKQYIRATASQCNRLLGEIGKLTRKRDAEKGRQDAKIQAAKDLHGPKIDELNRQIEALVQELLALVVPNFLRLVKPGTKTIELRNGAISHRLGAESLVVEDDEASIVQRIRAHGGLRKFTRRSKIELDKPALKKNPDFVAKIKGLVIQRKEIIDIKPSRAKASSMELGTPLKITLPEDD